MTKLYSNENFRIEYMEDIDDVECQYQVIYIPLDSIDFECQSYAQAMVAADQFNYTIKNGGDSDEYTIDIDSSDSTH